MCSFYDPKTPCVPSTTTGALVYFLACNALNIGDTFVKESTVPPPAASHCVPPMYSLWLHAQSKFLGHVTLTDASGVRRHQAWSLIAPFSFYLNTARWVQLLEAVPLKFPIPLDNNNLNRLQPLEQINN